MIFVSGVSRFTVSQQADDKLSELGGEGIAESGGVAYLCVVVCVGSAETEGNVTTVLSLAGRVFELRVLLLHKLHLTNLQWSRPRTSLRKRGHSPWFTSSRVVRALPVVVS